MEITPRPSCQGDRFLAYPGRAKKYAKHKYARNLSPWQLIEARYPEQKAATARTLSKEVSQYFIEQTKQLTQWIEERLHETRP